MMFPRLPSPFRHILWATALAAALGAAYSEMHVLQRGGQRSPTMACARRVDRRLIGGVLTSFDAFVLGGRSERPLRRAPFTVHVAVRTGIYLIVILLALKLGECGVPVARRKGH